MKHVVKQEWMGCAVATAAMLADVRYEEVATSRSQSAAARLRYRKAFRLLLERVTGTKWYLRSSWLYPPALGQFAFPKWPVATFVQDAPFRPRFGQWIVVNGDLVHDPAERTVFTLDKYPRRAWRMACWAQPVQPAELVQNQKRRRVEAMRNILWAESSILAMPDRETKPDRWSPC